MQKNAAIVIARRRSRRRDPIRSRVYGLLRSTRNDVSGVFREPRPKTENNPKSEVLSIMKKIVIPHDPSWKEKYLVESTQIQQVLGDNVVAIHHIGSTSIPDILSKPIIDILVVTLQHKDVDRRAGDMSRLGYECLGEYGIEGRRYFRKSDEKGNRIFHVHAFEQASVHILEHLAFRDFLLAHPQKAKEYSELKASLTAGGMTTRADYQNGKIPFVRATQEVAIDWYQAQQ